LGWKGIGFNPFNLKGGEGRGIYSGRKVKEGIPNLNISREKRFWELGVIKL